ncbi:MAG TPA: insulinase family protein [candidate division Zixibacteria bacterium]|nr:insulinase family protein [candidate division Zixibacteria bacterium]
MYKYLIVLVCLLLPIEVHAKQGEIQIDAKTHTFANGLQLIVVERDWSPTVSMVVRFKVGSADEHPGITGSAHLLEHMLFKGTPNMGTTDYAAEVPLMAKIDTLGHALTAAIDKTRKPLYRGDMKEVDSLKAALADIQNQQKKYIIKDEFWETYLKNGGSSLNASTSNDGTQYYVSFPANKIELWAYMESDRMADPILREFYSERDVVYEERRLRTDNDPGGKLEEQLNAAAFTSAAYGWPVVGWASDLETVTREEVNDFFHQYYAPNNAVIAIVGDVKFNDMIALVGKYFDSVPPSKIPPPPVQTTEPEQKGERRLSVEYDANPEMVIGWHMPGGGGIDQEVFDIVSSLLSRGRTSRLYKSLVEDKQIASSVYAGSDFARFPSLFTIWVTPKAPHTLDEVEKAIYDEIDKLKTDGPTKWELERTRNQIESDYVRGMQSNLGMAFRLEDMQALTGDWTYINKLKGLREKVASDDVKRVLAKYFIKDNRTVAFLVKPDSTSPKQEAAIDPTKGAAK